MSRRSDPVTPEMHALVMARDGAALLGALTSRGMSLFSAQSWFWTHPVCVAPIVDADELQKCWGRSTMEHVKDDLRMAVRAASDLEHLVALCQGHTEDGMKAGHIWNTSNRMRLRAYLAKIAQAAEIRAIAPHGLRRS